MLCGLGGFLVEGGNSHFSSVHNEANGGRSGSLHVLGARFLAQSRKTFLKAECGGEYRDLLGYNHVVAQTQVGERETTSKVPHF